MTKKDKKGKSKKESKKKKKLVTTSPAVDPINDKSEELINDKIDEFDKLLQAFTDSKSDSVDQSDVDIDDYSTPENDLTPDNTSINCPQFQTIAHTLITHDWKLDICAIDNNILHISKDDQQFILYLFYGNDFSRDKKIKDNEWLADEEKFNGEEPLWFSANSHIISPLYAAFEYFNTLNSTEASYSEPIVVMMYPHYIINTEDMEHNWDGRLIVSIDRLCKLIEAGEDLDRVHIKVDDIGHEPDEGKSYKAIDIPLEELGIGKNKSSEREEKAIEIVKESIFNDGIDTDADGFKEIGFKNVRFNIDPITSTGELLQLKSTYFRSAKNCVLFTWFDLVGEVMPNAQYTNELRDTENRLIASENTALLEIPHDGIYLPIDHALIGKYWFYIKHNGKELYRRELTFVDLEKGYEKYLEFEAFALYRINIGEDEGDHISIAERGAKSCFDYNNLAGVLATPQFKNISGKKLPYQISVTIKNKHGEIVYVNDESGILDIDEQYLFIGEVQGVVCPTGNYTITTRFFDEIIFVTDFVVGHKDVSTTYRASQLIAQSGRSATKEIEIEDPMEELNSMIGLDKLKKQLHKSIAKIQLEKIRKEQGLPVKAQQLHMAFLGNPGTGKTTVAKLLGQIYKNIGILSSGHVVLEDRSTLMTQNWGGEGELVNKALEKARGGILFIDEAYDLVTEHKSDPGKLIISALLQAMSDEKRRDFMVIFAGYTMPMERLLSKNPGLRSRLSTIYFDDYRAPELMQIADLWLGKNCYRFTPDARKYFESIVVSAYASRNENFGNARYVINLLENEVQPAMAERVMEQDTSTASFSLLTTIEACDIPNYNAEKDGSGDAVARLDRMVGLSELKSQIRSHLSYIRFVQARRDSKIDTPIPPLHMIFTGNPGTGKSSVAEYMGDIYRSMGILSVGNVIKVTRADMIDSAIGGTEEKMKELINASHGNILFIDEAYTLFSKSEKDFGKNAVEVLLDALGKESVDMIVIMAGYPKEMEELLTINPGLKGRFPYTFNFEDYNEEELFEIAEGVVKQNSLNLTKGAKDALKAVIRKECKIKDSNFSNARFVVRLITTQVLPNMAMRLEGETDPAKLKRIHQRDIPIEYKEIRMINENLFDEEMIEAALGRLDSMVGLTKVKAAIHQFVDFARNINRKDPTQIERYPLKWSFVGNTGTGKSSVAEVLSEILKAMHLLGKGHTVEVKAEELYGVATYKADELLQQRMRESLQGLLFVDGDAPQFRAVNSNYNPDHLRMTLAANTAEIHGRFAVVIAEQDSPKVGLTKSLSNLGITNFDHTLIFDDYTPKELTAILLSQLKKHDLTLSHNAEAIMYRYITKLRTEILGTNASARTMKELARTIRNLYSASGCNGNIIAGEVVEKFLIPQSTPQRRKKIGYI